MGCRNRESSHNEETAVSASIGDALLFTTMCIIGLPVDVHIKDGSIYTGIFHTVCVEDDYGIVLKRARMTKKGNGGANVANGGLIETLVVLSEDLVQVVAKGVLLPSNCFSGSAAREDVGASIESAERDEKSTNSRKSDCDALLSGVVFPEVERTLMCIKQLQKGSCSSRTTNGFANGFTPTASNQPGNAFEVGNKESGGIDFAKKEASGVSVIARQVGDGESRAKQGANEEKYKFQKNQTMHESQCPSPSFDTCATQSKLAENGCVETTHKVLPNSVPSVTNVNEDHERIILEEIPRSSAITAAISFPVSSVADGTSETSKTTPSEFVPPKSSSSKRTYKEFKLNPSAKIFSPSFVNQRAATPPAVPTATSVTYIQDNCSTVPIAPGHPGGEIAPFAPHPSVPVKFVPYGNLVAGNAGSDVQYSQPIVGHMGNRAQPTRHAGQYHHPVQTGPTYMHPNSQNVMVGRLGPLVYVHPVSHELVQGATTISQVSTCPLLTPHQVHLPKHQGNAAAAQALQLCVTTPPFITNGQQPFTVPAHIPISQQAFIRPIPHPGTNGFFGSKFS